MSLLRSAIQNWFLIGIVLVIILAKVSPNIGAKGGFLKPEVTVKYIGVSIIFFNSGLSLKTEKLTAALCQVNVHLFVQCFTFIVIPFLLHIVVLLLQTSPLEAHLLDGLRLLSCMPPPVSSAVLLTKAAGGNEAAAIFNSALGSFLGVFITPALILATLSSTVVLPLILGQMLRAAYKRKLERNRIPFGAIGSIVLLVVIYTTFCDTFSHREIHVEEMSLVSVVMLVIVLQAGLMMLVFAVSKCSFLGLQPADTVALVFCCTHKSLTLGIPIIKIIFGGYDGLSVISIPLLVYHPVQILLGGLLVPTVKAWLITTERFRYMYPSRQRFAQFLQV
ncbi:sodium/bile acid cotransporter 7-B-like isoform X3 [Haliotis cracherodii]|uniref:sodium/bile acid cotransporter 7-B-like isoform X3 n=1 Tax=Haliotis rufescens TaxID=6454 RepID=UPI001EAFE5AE|nr:sodium/bile acid cotransporter 7-B-like isoform X3 [Haliotis rufescens]